MNPTVIIPARFGSERFPGKPLHMIGRRPLIEWTWRAAMDLGWHVIIATDDDDIAAVARAFSADVQMTGPCSNGTERCAQVVIERAIATEFVINWQGDSPLCPPEWPQMLVECLEADAGAQVATPCFEADAQTVRRLRADHLAGVKGATTAAISRSGRALYFSKAILEPAHFHVGLYAYRLEALMGYGTQPCPVEEAEGLEQLRFLDLGMGIAAAVVPARPIWEVNNPCDVEIVAELLGAWE